MTSTQGGPAISTTVTLADLDAEPYALMARLRDQEPVAWVPVLDGWLVTRRDLCIEVARRRTVHGRRSAVLDRSRGRCGMLSLDGEEHRRHRDPFADAFRRPQVAGVFTPRR